MSEGWIIRHAQSQANIGLKSKNPTSIPITNNGEGQAQKFSEKVVKRPDIITVTEYIRTQQTANRQ